jgi:hypothetical protein
MHVLVRKDGWFAEFKINYIAPVLSVRFYSST